MTKPIDRDPIFRGYVFDADIVLLCVRWYISYRLTYRDLVEMMAARGIRVTHTTILRWALRFIPEIVKRWDRFRRPVGASWRVDETYVCIRGRWHYLYRAVDQHGKTIDFPLRPDRGIAAARPSSVRRSTRTEIGSRAKSRSTVTSRAARRFGDCVASM